MKCRCVHHCTIPCSLGQHQMIHKSPECLCVVLPESNLNTSGSSTDKKKGACGTTKYSGPINSLNCMNQAISRACIQWKQKIHPEDRRMNDSPHTMYMMTDSTVAPFQNQRFSLANVSWQARHEEGCHDKKASSDTFLHATDYRIVVTTSRGWQGGTIFPEIYAPGGRFQNRRSC